MNASTSQFVSFKTSGQLELDKKASKWHNQQIITRCKNGDWHIISGNQDLDLESSFLDLHCITFIAARLAIRKEYASGLPAQIAYFPP